MCCEIPLSNIKRNEAVPSESEGERRKRELGVRSQGGKLRKGETHTQGNQLSGILLFYTISTCKSEC